MSNPTTAAMRLDVLDFLRGIAAQLVVINHMRATYFADFAEISARDPITIAFYTLTGFGHQAVIIFFVVSGFLVGGAGWRAYAAQTWHPVSFFLRRIARLWIVLIPALIFTLLIDSLGRSMTPPLYMGDYFSLFTSGPDPSSNLESGQSLTTLLGNVAFLQTIEVPVYGTNSPLWSLANEFWYYVLFILALTVAAANQHVVSRLICVAGLIYLLSYLPGHILIPGLVWCAGAAVAIGLQMGLVRRFDTPALIAATGVFLGAMLAARFGALSSLGAMGSDLVIGIATALFVMATAHRAQLPQRLARFAFFTSEYSYTAYLVHFPILMILAALFFEGTQVTLSFSSLAVFCGIYLGVNVVAYLFYLAFEAHTVKVQRAIATKMNRTGGKTAQ